ncbi:MAG: gluconate kinase [Denitrovibrio sp.]|nr:MAG: gluconate kinase [Denitrovibrio sp.]
MEVTETPVVTVMKDILRPDEIIETHISYVFIKDEYVYKVKKSVDFGFLDYTSKKKRKAMCIVEKDLNERFSKDVYIDVLKVASMEKSFGLVPFDSSLLTLDYCLKMKKIPDDAFLSNKLKAGEVDTKDAFDIGVKIANLFKSVKTDPFAVDMHGGAEVIRQNLIENFQQMRPFVGDCVNEEVLNFLEVQTNKFLDDNAELLAKRVKDGFVVDGHGDLRLEHIYIEGDSFGLIDCIEFNRRFRFNDVISEIAFLCMDADQQGETAFADGLLGGFLSIYDDDYSKKLINFYRTYRACVRAKVSCFVLAEKTEEWSQYADKTARAKQYLDMAVIYSLGMSDTKAMIFYGLMASGKSKNARLFSEKYPVEHVNTDVVRKLMNGIDPDTSVEVDFGADLYSKENSIKLYEYLGELAENNRTLGRMTLIDGSFSKNEYIESLNKNYSGEYIKIHFSAPDDVIIKRLEERADKVTASDGRAEIYDQQKASAEDIGADFEIETTGKVEDNALTIIGYLINEA